MKQSSKEIELNHKPLDIFNIVLDIEKYPDYIPWCSKIEILESKNQEITANMIVDYKFFPTQIFTSHVHFDKRNLIIKTKYIDGPLKNLNTIWIFKKLKKNNCTVNFKVNFEFKNFIHQKIAELFFPLIESKMIDSFIKRADKILN